MTNENNDEDKPLFVSIRRELLDEVIKQLDLGMQYAKDALINHDSSLSRTIKSNRFLAEQMENEIAEMKETIDKLERHR